MMTPSFYSMFSTPTVEPITTETPPELINLAEFDEHIEMEIVEEETESETRFNYAVIASLSSGENLEPGR
uniref:Uncharacterized protein n=1 Tax=Ciona savignyi TaxID=51511 RepID=H2Y856_CIOSA